MKKVKNLINLWKTRGLSIYGKVNIIKSILFPKMIYPSSILSTPVKIINEFLTLIFTFLWNGKDKVANVIIVLLYLYLKQIKDHITKQKQKKTKNKQMSN